MMSPMPRVVVASPAIAPRSPGGISLKSSPHESVITVPPAIATTKTIGRYQPCHSCAQPAREQPEAVDERGAEDHAAEAEAGRRARPTTAAATM